MAEPPRTRANADATVDTTRHEAESRVRRDPGATSHIVAVFPADVGFGADLGTTGLTIGRAPEDDASPSLLHPTISRQHLRIDWDKDLGELVVRDEASRNGSWINGKKLHDRWTRLEPGDVLRVGSVVLVTESGGILRVKDSADVARSAVPGRSMDARRLRHAMARAAPDLSPVLVIGETGTGKEQIARELHRLSGRSGAFVPVNCATLGEQLIESQLFGHTKGAFTGATQDQEGLFSAANGGTLFLDEIGEMPLSLQPKLLRAIQEREVRRVGSTREERVDTRVIAATHRPLGDRIKDGSFRQDLYARLALWEIHVPPLRVRRADILLWISILHDAWQRERGRHQTQTLAWTPEAAEVLVLAPWRDNLRGLGRLIHEVSRDGTTDATLAPTDLPSWIS